MAQHRPRSCGFGVIGQDSGKLGAWFEEDYVVLQLLRLLSEEIESIMWESRHDDGKGIDCWLREHGVRVAIQCKTSARKNWTLWRLATDPKPDRSILVYAKSQLERDPKIRYRLVHDAQCPELDDLIAEAKASDDDQQWWDPTYVPNIKEVMGAWELSPDDAGDRATAHAFLRRMKAQKVGGLSGHIKSIGGLLVGKEKAGELIQCLTDLARDSLTRELRVPEVRAAVALAGIRLEPRAYDPKVHVRLADLTKGFLDRVIEVRQMEPVQRPEAERALVALRESSAGSIVLVHGPAGCGKSEVISTIVDELRSEHTPILTLMPDQDHDEIGLGANPVAALVRCAAGGRAVLVIDQLDQILTVGHAQSQLRRCRDWLREARDAKLNVLVGCRTVDAEKETQLSHLLADSTGRPTVKIVIADFPESTVAEVLAAHGVAVDDLEPPVRALARRPLFLRLLVETLDKGGSLSGLRSAVTVVDQWWETVSASLPGCDAARAGRALDQLLSRMDEDGTLSAPEDSVNDSQAIEELLRAGVLVREQRRHAGYLRSFHQVLADTRIAQQWRDVAGSFGLLQKLGDRPHQTWHDARRLRLAVPLILERPRGAEMLDEVVTSNDVRPLVQRALLLGVAAIDQPSSDVIELVMQWLDDDELRDRVLNIVVRGHVPFIEALSEAGRLDEAWKSADSDQRERLLDLLASVATRWGNGVAAHLTRWMAMDPKVIDQAHHIFVQAPGDDTDELFAMRKEFIARNLATGSFVDWKALLRDQPLRAFELLAVVLGEATTDDLISKGAQWSINFPTTEDLPPEAATAGVGAWLALASWWKRLNVKIDDPVTRYRIDGGVLPRIVELLARCMAHDLHRDPSGWAGLLGDLPDPPREIDGWLLLRVGANLPAGAGDAADILARWFMSDPGWARVCSERLDGRWSLKLVRGFVVRIGVEISDAVFKRLESWIADYRDPWSVEDEERRPETMPTAVGVTAYRLLGELPENRLSINSRSHLLELGRKFDGKLPEEEGRMRGGSVRSVVPERVADGWSVTKWRRHLKDLAQSNPARDFWAMHQLDEDSIGEYTLSALTSQLRGLAYAYPKRYLAHARAFDASVPPEAREALLASVTMTEAPDHYSGPEPWEGLGDTEVVEIVASPQYLDEPSCARQIAWIVAGRPRATWPDQVIKRLVEMACGETSAGLTLDNTFGLLGYRMNETACAALRALGQVAEYQPERQPEVLAVAGELIEHNDPGRRASAAAAAVKCFESDPARVTDLVLLVAKAPLVAAENEMIHALIWFAAQARSPETRDIARERLLALTKSEDEHISEQGGHIVVALRRQDLLSDRDLEGLLTGDPHVRLGAAKEIGAAYAGGYSSPWLLERALRLADDPDKKTGDAVIHGFASGPADGFTRDLDYLRRLLATGAAHRNLHVLIDACDRQDQLLSVADQVISLCDAAAAPEEHEVEYWSRWENSRTAVGILARLAEEAEREQDHNIRIRAFDAWDRLLEVGDPSAAGAFDMRLASDVWDSQP